MPTLITQLWDWLVAPVVLPRLLAWLAILALAVDVGIVVALLWVSNVLRSDREELADD